MNPYRSLILLMTVAVLLVTTGCASYRVSSNVQAPTPAALPASQAVLISEDALPARKYREIGPIDVSVKKLTIFHANPTREQANDALTDKARAIGADGVVKVKYDYGVGLTTWGYMDAKGIAVKFIE